MPPRVAGGFAYFDNDQEYQAAMAAYNGQGPYPARAPQVTAGAPEVVSPAVSQPTTIGGITYRPPGPGETVRPTPGITGGTAPNLRPTAPPAAKLPGAPSPAAPAPAAPSPAAPSPAAQLPGAPTTGQTGSGSRDAQAGWIVNKPGGGMPTLMEPGKGESPLPPGIGEAIRGGRPSPYRTLGNLPRFSAQTLANMTSTEREALGTLANRTGNYDKDFFEKSQQLSAMPTGPSGSYAGAPRRRF